jgi:hypothetical protein
MSDKVTGAIKHAVMGHANDKIDQLKANTVEPTENSRITSDYGVKQNNTDEWLRVSNEDQTGPALLEDSFGREKVHITHLNTSITFITNTNSIFRSTDSIMSVFPSVLSMPEALALLVHSDFSSPLPM